MMDKEQDSAGETICASAAGAFRDFERGLRAAPDPRRAIAKGVIGKDCVFEGALGPRTLVYADYVASGRALKQVEAFILERVLPVYANSHSEASFCGCEMTRMREEARKVIGRLCGADAKDYAVIFSGAGATSALNQVVHLLGLRPAVLAGENPQVLVGPYEHHSNLLPWRESGATVIEIEEAKQGGPDLDHLARMLAQVKGKGPLVGAFSAASNVTGILSPIEPVTRLVKQAGGRVVWDFAGGGPYLSVDMRLGGGIDAACLSPHKFVGGPGASGVLILRREAVVATVPSRPGGGTVAFVNSVLHDYTRRIEEREEGGTPNIIGDIRAALALIVKDVVGQDFITARNAELTRHAFAAWRDHPNLNLLGSEHANRLPIFSLAPHDDAGQPLDYLLFTQMLSDIYGIQARGGCACAGPYGHRLMAIDADWSNRIRASILAGDESVKPGFVRLNLSFLMDDDTVDYILRSVAELGRLAPKLAANYPESARRLGLGPKPVPAPAGRGEMQHQAG
jgi:selenocysteine lyase/cysteine desulfurase